MQKTTTALETPLKEQLDRLAAFEPDESPVLSLYLDLRPDQHGRRRTFDAFLRKAIPDRIRTLSGDAKKSAEADAARIHSYIDGGEIRTSASGLAIFACSAREHFFEAVQLEAPLEEHALFIGPAPHLFPLARLNDQFPRYAALLLDTNKARIFVFGLGTAETQKQITNEKTRKTSMGGWSQARFQRRVEKFHLDHVKEVVTALDKLVTEEHINHIIIGCEEVARPILNGQMPKHLAEKVVDLVTLDVRTPEHEVLANTLDALRQKDEETDIEHVEAMLGAWRAGGLGTAGPEGTLDALERGQVEELLITTRPEQLKGPEASRDELADQLVTKAQQTSARIRFIEDPALLAEVGGVGALLRFRI